MAIQAAGSFGALGGDLSGINQFFERQAASARQAQALQAQAQQAQQAQAAQQAIAQMQNATAMRGQDLQRELGLGSQGIDLQRLSQQGSQFGQSLGLDRERLGQQGQQFETSQANDLQKFFESLTANKDQFSKTHDLAQGRQEFEIEIGGKKFKLSEKMGNAEIANTNARTADIPKQRANEDARTGAYVKNVDSEVGYRTDSTKTANDRVELERKKQEDEATRATIAYWTNQAHRLDPNDPQRVQILNYVGGLIQNMQTNGGQYPVPQGGGYGGPSPVPTFREGTRFADSDPNADANRELAAISQFFANAGNLPNDKARQFYGKKLGIEQEAIDSMMGEGGAVATKRTEGGRVTAIKGLPQEYVNLYNDLLEQDLDDDGQRMTKTAIDRLIAIEDDKGREDERQDLLFLVNFLKDNQDADFATNFEGMRFIGGAEKGRKSPEARRVIDVLKKYYDKGAQFSKQFNFLGD